MSHSPQPAHIAMLYQELNLCYDPEDVLLKNLGLVTKDSMLYELYLEWSFDPELRLFTEPPAKDTVLSRIREVYMIDEDWCISSLLNVFDRGDASIDYA